MNEIDRLRDALDRHYGEKLWTQRKPILDELILTILSQNTTARNRDEAFRTLRKRFPTWERGMRASPLEIAEAIRVGGLANRKAPRIRGVLQDIHSEQGKLDLEWLADVPDDQAMEYLLRFDGVGRKTAACVLMFALGRPVLPVDTHVHRVATKLGLIGRMSADAAHDALQEIVPSEHVYSFHVNTVLHGRQVCQARTPKCHVCCVKEHCDYYARQAGTG